MADSTTTGTAAFQTLVHVRDVALPAVGGRGTQQGAGTMALLTMDNGGDHRKPTLLNAAALTSLSSALDTVAARVAAGELVAVGITGKPFFFAAGADLSAVGSLGTRDQARGIAELGHRALRRLSELGVPSFAFINGLALGGGLEVALHCTYRTVGSAALVGLPETLLGLVPGWGGAYLLPRLMGPRAAVQVIVSNPLQQNKLLDARSAVGLGVADVEIEMADFLVQSLRWASGVLADPTSVARPDHLDDPAWQPVVAAARAQLTAKVGDGAPAPHRALDLIAEAQHADVDTAYAAEDDALVDLVTSDQFRAGLYAFDLVQRRARRAPAGVDPELARPVRKVGVVGAGLMASQLALLFARRLDVPVVMTDLDPDRLATGIGYVRGEVAKLLDKGRISPDKANRLNGLVTGSVTKAAFTDADLVIEAVFEKLEVKRDVFAQLEAVVSPECVLASNTSSLSLTAMADGLAHPQRVVGMHFFNPVAVMPLLEIVHTPNTDPATLATAFATARSLRKTTIGVADAPSFVVNRLLGRLMAELGAIVDEGTPVEAADAAVAGMAPMPPFALLGLVGPAIALHNNESLAAAFPDRFTVPEGMRAVVAAGKQAYYLPAEQGGAPVVDPEVVALLPRPQSPVVASREAILTRVLDALADEARRMLDAGVVTEPADLDLAMITGAGFTFYNGGLLPLLDRSGAAQRATGRRFLPPGVASMP
jgi:3-hydroxyacyl-CoA dehydrogenase/enoyl-CoA hydratase/carnithine racemase